MPKKKSRTTTRKPPARRSGHPQRAHLARKGRIRLDTDAWMMMVHGMPAEPAGLIAVAGAWMWSAADKKLAANHCIDAGRVIVEALAQFGVQARLEPAMVEIDSPIGHTQHGTPQPHWNKDGSYNGHVVIWAPSLNRFVDVTLHQYPELPRGGLTDLPLMALFPPGVTWGQAPSAALREDHTITYYPVHDNHRDSWNHGPVPQMAEGYHQAGVNLASHTFELLRTPQLREKMLACSAYPRLQQLFSDLGQAEAVVRGTDYYFRTETGTEVRLDQVR